MRVAIAIVFIWAGFILSISFFESWVKFRAAGVTLPAALSIGKLVFTILNRIEWVFLLVLMVSVVISKTQVMQGSLLYMLVTIVLVLALQTFWLLPELNVRAVSRINGLKVAASNLHHYFVCAEVVKLISLISIGTKFFKLL